jgi:hypothetical protein
MQRKQTDQIDSLDGKRWPWPHLEAVLIQRHLWVGYPSVPDLDAVHSEGFR